jgi:dinuclear metal center YbgI/SA1388 family protein
MPKGAPSLAMVVDVLQEIAPLELAAEWDNVGMVLEPRARPRAVARVLLTVDLTAAVVDEAARGRVDLVVAYHPPIFHGLKQLRAGDARQQVVLAAIAAGLPVWSPHTALDASPGGLADWLAEGVAGRVAPKSLRPCGEGEFGRVVELERAVPLSAMIARIKGWLGVRAVRLAATARGLRQPVRTVAVAAGAGASVLRGQRADLWVTGELPHHDTVAAVAAGTAVVCAEHSNTERGFLRVLAARLREPFGRSLDVRLARADRDPFAAR